MTVAYGRRCPKGMLPVYFVGSEEEAKRLVVLSCEKSMSGEYVARELAQEQTLENLDAFSERLDRYHTVLVQNGGCECK